MAVDAPLALGVEGMAPGPGGGERARRKGEGTAGESEVVDERECNGVLANTDERGDAGGEMNEGGRGERSRRAGEAGWWKLTSVLADCVRLWRWLSAEKEVLDVEMLEKVSEFVLECLVPFTQDRMSKRGATGE